MDWRYGLGVFRIAVLYEHKLLSRLRACLSRTRLEGVMKECQKTANVDLQKLITDSENCAQCLKHLVTVETNPGRVVCDHDVYSC